MGTFLELFQVLDDWDPETLPERVDVNPDETLASIRKHLAEGNVLEAQRIISEEISRLRPMVHAVLLDAVDLVQEKGNTPFHFLQYLSYLHRRAAQILLSEQRWDEARQHILKAVVLAPDDDDPRYVLVEIYEHTSQYDAALHLLESLVTGRTDRCLPLFELALSIHQQGVLSAAATCYQRVKELDDVGIFRDLADIHLGALEMPLADIEMLKHVSQEGSKAALARDYESALTSFQRVLAWSPKHSQTWVRVGYLYQRRASEELDLVKDAQAIPVFKVANGQQQNDLRCAAQAYRIAILAEPGLAGAWIWPL
jgi:tetratricopeptide (TPR) repeat protein